MINFNYESVSAYEFEEMCSAILSQMENCRFERFKEGKDEGVDLRHVGSGKCTIFQCKRMTKFGTLYSALKNVELPKVKALNPSRYGVISSCPLSPRNKRKIKDLFAPYILSEGDIIGRDELNDILAKPEYEHIVNQTIGLWWQSYNVLTRTYFSWIFNRTKRRLSAIVEKNRFSYWTEGVHCALKKLRENNVVVVAGQPGVGKTTAAELLLLHAYKEGYEPIIIRNGVEEAEKVWNERKSQVFYFDDFLGSNYIEAMKHSVASAIMDFIEDVRKADNKLFILTSRTVILKSASCKSKPFLDGHLTEASYIYEMPLLSEFDKAHILHSLIKTLSAEERIVDDILQCKRYMSIIRHRNFNPRLMKYILKQRGLKDSANIFQEIIRLLNTPGEVWDIMFRLQVKELEVLLTWAVFLKNNVSDKTFRALHDKFAVGGEDIRQTLELMNGTLVTREVDGAWKGCYRLQDPSIGDYLISKVGESVRKIIKVLKALDAVGPVKKAFDMIHKIGVGKEEFEDAIVEWLNELDFCDGERRLLALTLALKGLEINKDRFLPIVIRKWKNVVAVDDAMDNQTLSTIAEMVKVVGQYAIDDKKDYFGEMGLDFNSYEIMLMIQHNDDHLVALNLIQIAKSLGRVLEYDLLSEPLTYRIVENINYFLDGCAEPEYEFYGSGDSWEIPSDEKRRLEKELADSIGEYLSDYDVPSGMVNVEDIVHDVDFCDYFCPSNEEIDRHRDYEYDRETMWYRGGSLNVVQREESIDSLFASLKE